MDVEMPANPQTDEQLIQLVDDALNSLLKQTDMPPALLDAVSYSLFSGGKRIRPLLSLRACEALGVDVSVAVHGACAVELIHTFSLVHDDLPAMDDDDMRRGRPTLHKHTNEAMAILAGDAMTALAFERISRSKLLDDAQRTECNKQLAIATQRMIAGQVYDTMGGQNEALAPIGKLRTMHDLKTGALIVAAIRMGTIAARAEIAERNALHSYGYSIGRLFQAVDDLLDVTQTAEKVGKATGKDAEQGKLTYPGLLGIDGTRAEIDKLLSQALDALSGFDAKADPLRDMANKLATRER